MFSRREFNIDSLSVGVTESPDFSRITVVVHGDEYLVDQMIKQLEKLPDVVAVQRLDAAAAVYRGMVRLRILQARAWPIPSEPFCQRLCCCAIH